MTKILVIEDELSVRENILELLEAEYFDVIGTENGFLGALWAQENLPDLIICDVMMPQINGYEVLNTLREVPMTASIPFIFLTAMADKTDIRRGMELGADDYLTKPFTREELLAAITSRLTKRGIVMQQYNAEHQRAEALQQKVEELQQYANSQDQLLKQLEQELQNALPKLNLAINLLKKVEPGTQRDRGLKILQEACANEISMLKKMSNLQDLLSSENADLLRQFNEAFRFESETVT